MQEQLEGKCGGLNAGAGEEAGVVCGGALEEEGKQALATTRFTIE